MTLRSAILTSENVQPDTPTPTEKTGRRPKAAHIRNILTVFLLAIAAFFVSAAQAGATTPERAIKVVPADMRAGSLLLKNDDDSYAEAPRLGTDVDITVSGPTLRARVTQMFHNPTTHWVEAVYVYPLPEGGAVDTLKMVVGDRIIVGDIKERKAARAIYEQAKRDGKKAALTEQERPNIFTNSVANIGPGETVLVQIEYQEPVHRSGDTFSLRVPLVVAPRYNPAPVVQSVDLKPDGSGWGGAKNDPVPDRERITPPVLDPRVHAPTNPVTITVRLQAGFALGEVKSAHHEIKTETIDDTSRVVKLADGVVPADRDFELTWKPKAANGLSVGLFREHVGHDDYLLAFVMPPAVAPAEKQPPREVIFVIDNSGSMGGTSIVQAKASLIYALGRLKPADRFNVIRFDNTFDVMFADTVPADAEHIARAKAFVDSLQAQGGTEMVPAMRAALTDRRAGAGGPDGKYVRQVVFLTDGAIGNEQQLFDTITAGLGRSRVFMVGIGSAPNSFLMTRAAELGRGTFTHIGSSDQVETRMRDLFAKLENPVVTGLSARLSTGTADLTPDPIPDLYRGEVLVLAARLGDASGDLQINGEIGGRPWSIALPVEKAAEGKGISKVWARRKITDAELARTLRKLAPQESDRRILKLALDHHLVTRLTSLVAVDKTPSRPEGEHLKVAELPLNLPAGWDFDKVFGERRPLVPPPPREQRADDGQPAPTKVAARDAATAPGSAAKRRAQAMPAAPQAQFAYQSHNRIRLPKTATNAELLMLLGLELLVLTLLFAAFTGRRAVKP